MAHEILSIELEVDEADYTSEVERLQREALRQVVKASNQFAVDLLRAAKKVVPFGPKGTYSEADPTTGKRRYANKQGPGHPGMLQRSGRLTAVIQTATSWERTVLFGTPYAHYQHVGMSRQSRYTQPLEYSRDDRQANYLYQSGKRPGEKSPLEDMLSLGRIGELRLVA
jgi:hypothetical protein